MWWIFWYCFAKKIIAKSAAERILKVSYLTKLETKNEVEPFSHLSNQFNDHGWQHYIALAMNIQPLWPLPNWTLSQQVPSPFPSSTCPRRKFWGISGTGFIGWMSFLSPNQQRQSTARKNHPLTSSVLHPPLDSWQKGRCFHYTGSPTPIPTQLLHTLHTTKFHPLPFLALYNMWKFPWFFLYRNANWLTSANTKTNPFWQVIDL